MSVITYFRYLKEEKQRKIQAQKEKEKRMEIIRKRKEWYENLDKTPHEEMFRILREKGGIKSLKELQETNQLSPEIKRIWRMTIDDMIELSMNFEKVRRLCDARHMYFIPHDLVESWDRDTEYFLVALGRLDELNSFFEVSKLGRLYFLNPLNEPIDTSNDDEIKKELLNLYKGLLLHNVLLSCECH